MGDSNDNQEGASSCCNSEQTAFCALYVFYVILALITWKSIVAKPMRLIAVFLHEMSHATACWLTGGHVVGIQVHENEGGVTRYMGGCRCLIIPAGYVGCSFCAMVFVVLSGGRKTATVAASVFTFSLLLSLCYSPSRIMVYLNLAYATITLTFIFLEWFVFTPLLTYVILFYGVLVGIFSVADIHDDLIVRSVEGSDAYACYSEIFPCCYPRCVGIQWVICAIFFQVFGLWLALVQLSEECQDESWWSCTRDNLKLSSFDVDFGDYFDFDSDFWDNGP